MSAALDLAHLKALCEKATKGPWWRVSSDVDKFFRPDALKCASPLPGGRERILISANPHFEYADDLDFIAAAREAMPKLIAALERANSIIEDGIALWGPTVQTSIGRQWIGRAALAASEQLGKEPKLQTVGTLHAHNVHQAECPHCDYLNRAVIDMDDKLKASEQRVRELEEAAREYLDANPRLYAESGQIFSPKARAKAKLIAALATEAP